MNLTQLREHLDDLQIDLSLLHAQKHKANGWDAIACSLGIIEKNRQIGYIKSQIELLETKAIINSDETQRAMTEAMKDYVPSMSSIKLYPAPTLELDDYQTRAKATDLYPPDVRLVALLMGLANESGEALGHYKKYLRGDLAYQDENALKTALIAEIGDALWYLSGIADALGVSLSQVAQANLDKLADRMARGVIKESGDER